VTAVRDLSFARQIDAVTETVCVAARDLSGADGATFALRVGDECFYAAENAIGPLWQGRRVPMADCISGWVMTHGQPVVIRDIYADPRTRHDAYRATFVHSLAVVPVRRERPAAAIGLYWRDHHEATPQEINVAEILADAASLALANVTLYEELHMAVAQERQARAEAEASSRAKDEWLSIVSHELRTPLAVIAGWVEALRRRQADPAEFQHALDAIARNSALLLRVVDDLLDAAKLTTGKLTLQLDEIGVRHAVAEVIEAVRPMAAARDVTVEGFVFDDIVVRADAERLHQILWNVVSNAVKFTPDGGRVDIGIRTSANQTIITVRDTGIGIEPSLLPRIFDRFVQADTSTTRSHGGLGLGLAIARQLTELHGGTISAASAGAGTGTLVEIALPSSPAAAGSTVL
jgi:signal transduction histidine kinase